MTVIKELYGCYPVSEFSLDGKYLSVGGDNQIFLFSLSDNFTLINKYIIQDKQSFKIFLTFNRKSDILVITMSDILKYLKLPEMNEIKSMQDSNVQYYGYGDINFSPDNKVLFLFDDENAHLLDSETLEFIDSLNGGDGSPYIAFHPDNTVFAYSANYIWGTTIQFNELTEKKLKQLDIIKDTFLFDEIELYSKNKPETYFLDSQYNISNDIFHIHQIKFSSTGKKIFLLGHDWISIYSFPELNFIINFDIHGNDYEDQKLVHFIKYGSKYEKWRQNYKRGKKSNDCIVRNFFISQDEQYLLVGTHHGFLYIWNIEDEKLINIIGIHEKGLIHLNIFKNFIISSSKSRLRIWDFQDLIKELKITQLV